MKRRLVVGITEAIDDVIIVVQGAMKANEIPSLQADEIIDGLLDARQATTAVPAREPEEVAA